ncbi:immunity 22 family protein [Acidovorax sp.]|uniref:immunity 22 family protein n=1 Tax=Acidovorax sp. TaxID=1872122 RepID=UPI002ACE5BAB|nr:immunity 22 family protein [Acidovorax sp.]MDZ7863755.1 immunity 22 family protein [Acidovorax sp.]
MPSSTLTSHFWVGRASQEQVDSYFAEAPGGEDQGDHAPISAFARDQGANWYDHDFLEYGWDGEASTTGQLVDGCSYSDQWADELAHRVAAQGIAGANFFVFIRQDQIEQPRSVQGEGMWLKYLGTITHRI